MKYTCHCGKVHGNHEMMSDNQKIIGHKYLESCGHYHTWNPLPPGVTFEEFILQETMTPMVEEEDALLLATILKELNDASKT